MVSPFPLCPPKADIGRGFTRVRLVPIVLQKYFHDQNEQY
jgi:hypothetical protein